ncbi:MAG: hypothetical protein HUU03_01500 [Planctomycetaceae bacterium]|nr:hypothetical protein [Planctomycetota bacterium]NUO15097.1 hypothetical protein [Planctomycetaceae bacterium]GIK52731.1 MAG: hypothetical protein BroJett014_17040 [Planctomycetota bacterium]
MKGGQLALLIWLLNGAVALGGLALGARIYQERAEDLDATFSVASGTTKFKANRIDWASAAKTGSVDISAFGYRELSPRKRPPPPKKTDPKPVDPPKPDPEPTDDQLKAELEREINAKFKLMRLMYSTDPLYAKALCTAADAGNAAIYLRPNLHFPTEYKDAPDPKIKGLAAKDYLVKAIEKDHVLIDAPSIKRPAKRFTVALKFGDSVLAKPPDPKNFGKAGGTSGGAAIPQPPKENPPVEAQPVPTAETRPKESVYDEKTDSWTIGTDDYMGVNTDDFVKYARTVVDEKGQPIGIQINEEIPDDNVVIKRGGKKGDIIKSINGQAVTNMSDVRRVVRQQYDSGVSEFEVLFERDGVPQRKMFKVPQKKK